MSNKKQFTPGDLVTLNTGREYKRKFLWDTRSLWPEIGRAVAAGHIDEGVLAVVVDLHTSPGGTQYRIVTSSGKAGWIWDNLLEPAEESNIIESYSALLVHLNSELGVIRRRSCYNIPTTRMEDAMEEISTNVRGVEVSADRVAEWLKGIDPGCVVSVYSGRVGCTCGCIGRHRYNPVHAARAEAELGRELGAEELSSRSVAVILGKVKRRGDAAVQAGTIIHVRDDAEDRQYIVTLREECALV